MTDSARRPRRLRRAASGAGALPLAALLCAALAPAAVLAPSAAEAQTSTVLISNFNQQRVIGGGGRPNPTFVQSVSQPFRTGSGGGGYLLNSVEMALSGWTSPRRPLFVELREDSSGNPSTTTLATFTNPSFPSGGGAVTFTAPEDTRLSPDTTYHLVLRLGGSSGFGPNFHITQRTTLDESLTGWSLPAAIRRGNVDATGGWSQHSFNAFYSLVIRGSELTTVTVAPSKASGIYGEHEALSVRITRAGNLASRILVHGEYTYAGIQDTPLPVSFPMAANQATTTVNIRQADPDNTEEPDRRLVFTVLDDPDGEYVAGDPSVATLAVLDDDGADARVSVHPVAGDIGEGAPAQFTLTRRGGDRTQALVVNLDTTVQEGGGALHDGPPITAVTLPTTATIPANEDSVQEDIPTVDDTLGEPDTVLRMDVGMPTSSSGTSSHYVRAGAGAWRAEVTVRDDDRTVVTIAGTFPDFEESDGSVQFRVTRMGLATGELRVRTLYTNRDGDEREIIATIPAGQFSTVITPETLTDDDVPSDPYTVSIALAASTEAGHDYIIGDPSEDTVTIYDRDGAPVISSARVGSSTEVEEGDTVEWLLSRTGDTAEAFTIGLNVLFDGGLSLDRYNDAAFAATIPTSATFEAGESTATVSLTTREDNVAENDGEVRLDLARTPTFAWEVEGTGTEESQRTRFTVRDDDPSAPRNLSATTAPMSIMLRWDAPSDTGNSDIAGYRIERSADGSTGWSDLEADTGNADTTYTHGGLTEGQVVHYRVSAINASSTGVASDTASGTAGGMGAGAPRNLAATGGVLSIRLTWDAPAGASGAGIVGYRIEQSANGASGWSVLVANTENTARVYAHAGLAANQTVHYRVRAVNAAGADTPSAVASATANALPSGTPTAEVRAQDATVVGDGVNEVVFLFRTSDSMQIDTHYFFTGRSAITGRTATNVLSGGNTSGLLHGSQRRIRTVALAPGSDPVEVTFTFIVFPSGLTESNHAIAAGRGSATVTVTAPPAPVPNPLLVRSTAKETSRGNLAVSANRWHAQSFRTGSNSSGNDGFDIDSVVLLLNTADGNDRASTSAVVTLREDDGGNPSDTILATMEHPSMIRHERLNFFTAPSGTRLDASTRYHVVVHQPAGAADSGIRLIRTPRQDTGLDNTRRFYNGTSWAEPIGENSNVLMLQVRGSEAPDPNVPEITVRAEADTVLGDGRNFVRFFLSRSGSFPQRRVQYTLPATGGVNDALETDAEATYTYGGSGTSEPIRLRTEALAPGSAPIDVTFNLLPGTGYRVGGTGSATVTVTPLPAPALVGNHQAVREALAVARRGRDYAQQFMTGSNAGGYTLDAVVLATGSAPLESGYDPSVPVTMTIRTVDAAGEPSTTVHGTLTEPATIIDGANAFTAQGTIELDADTSYYVVIGQDVASGGLPLDGPQTAQNGLDSDSLAGWTIEDRLLWNDGGSWGAAGNGGASRALAIRLAGDPVVPATPRVTVERQSEFATAGRDAVFTLTRVGGDVAVPLTVDIALTGEEAAYADYDGRVTTAVFAADETTVDVSVPTVDLFQGALDNGRVDTIVLTVQDGAGYDVGAAPDNAATVTLGGPPLQARLALASGQADTVDEGGGIRFTVTLYQPFSPTAATAGEAFTLRYALNNGACGITTGGADAADLMGGGAGSVDFAIGDGAKDFTVATLVDQDGTEGDERLCIELLPATTPVNAYGVDPGPSSSHVSATVRNVAPPPTATVTVPDAPTGLSATAGTQSIALSWTAPANTGGAPITGYRIEQSADGSTGWSDVVPDTGSTGTTYTHTGLSGGQTVHYRVSAINSAGVSTASGTANATAEAAVTPQTPAEGDVTIDGMELPRVGVALTANTDDLRDPVNGLTRTRPGFAFTYQWWRADDAVGANGAIITGATQASYTPVEADRNKHLRVAVEFTDDDGYQEGPVNSAWTTEVPEPVAATGDVTVDGIPQDGTAPQVDMPLTANTDDVDDPANGLDRTRPGFAFTYQWERADDGDGMNRQEIPGATQASYTLDKPDQGKHLRVVVTFSDDDGYTEVKTSGWTDAIQRRNNAASVGEPTIDGRVQVGARLRANTDAIRDPVNFLTRARRGDAGFAFTYRWERADAVSEAGVVTGTVTEVGTDATYRPVAEDEDKVLRVTVTFMDDDEYPETKTSDWTAPVVRDARVQATVERSLALFGRAVALQTLDAARSRLDGDCAPESSQLTVAGQRVGWNMATVEQSAVRWLSGGVDDIDGRSALAGSSFSLAHDGMADGCVSVWGRGAYSSYAGNEDGLDLEGSVTTGQVGADWSSGPWMLGLSVARSTGGTGYRVDGGDGGEGDIDIDLTGVYPYTRYRFTERLSTWAAAGLGSGDLKYMPQEGDAFETGIDLLMGAGGVRNELPPETVEEFSVAVKADAFFVQMEADAVADRLDAVSVDTQRLRLGLEGARATELQDGAMLTPTLELGLLHDRGGASDGSGMDVGLGVTYEGAANGLRADFKGRSLLAHEAGGAKEWGVSGELRYDPDPSSERGLALSLNSGYGARAEGGAEALFHLRDAGRLATRREELPGARLGAEAGYGLGAFGDRYVSKPWAGMGMTEGGSEWRLGWQLAPAAAQGPLRLRFGAELNERAGGQALMLNFEAGF